MDTKTQASKKLPRLSYNDLQGEWHSPERSALITQIDHLNRAILYPLCQWNIYWKGINAVKVLVPECTAPTGCIVRALTFVGNPGSSVVQLELMRIVDEERSKKGGDGKGDEKGDERGDESKNETKDMKECKAHYELHLYSAKGGNKVFSDQEWDIHQLILIWLRCLCKPNIPQEYDPITRERWIDPRPHLVQFKRDTGCKKLTPERWTHFEVLLHHVCLYPHNGTHSLSSNGWRMLFKPGDDLEFSRGYSWEVGWGSAIRGACYGYLDGDIHHYLCPRFCERCKVKNIQSCTHMDADTSTLVLKYGAHIK